MNPAGPAPVRGSAPESAQDNPLGGEAVVDAGAHGWATLFPTLCAIHCLVTPALIVAFPFLHFLKGVEPVLYGVSLVLAGWAVVSGFRRHRDVRVWVPTVLGAAVWGASIAGAFAPVPEALTDVGGGLLLAVGVYWSGQLRHRSVCEADCSCPAPH